VSEQELQRQTKHRLADRSALWTAVGTQHSHAFVQATVHVSPRHPTEGGGSVPVARPPSRLSLISWFGHELGVRRMMYEEAATNVRRVMITKL
jgi:hypothetical protein